MNAFFSSQLSTAFIRLLLPFSMSLASVLAITVFIRFVIESSTLYSLLSFTYHLPYVVLAASNVLGSPITASWSISTCGWAAKVLVNIAASILMIIRISALTPGEVKVIRFGVVLAVPIPLLFLGSLYSIVTISLVLSDSEDCRLVRSIKD